MIQVSSWNDVMPDKETWKIFGPDREELLRRAWRDNEACLNPARRAGKNTF